MQRIPFTKMHGLGNDFMVIDCTRHTYPFDQKRIQQWANRHFGVGFDQLLLVEAPRKPGSDFYYRIFNADGTEVEQCGNGARCFARFVRDAGLITKDHMRVETCAGDIELVIQADGQVQVDMGIPRFEPALIPFIAEQTAISYQLVIEQQRIEFSALSMGNPHCVIQVADITTAPVANLGALLNKHERFPAGVNVGFMEVLNKDHIRLRVFERGVGETLACGSGACAAVVAGQSRGLLHTKVQVDLPGGTLIISWQGDNQAVIMVGPAVRVYTGEIAW